MSNPAKIDLMGVLMVAEVAAGDRSYPAISPGWPWAQPCYAALMKEQRVSITVEGPIARVELCRPEKRNGLDLAMFRALRDAGDELAQDRSLRAVVLSGAGPTFCAGLDFASFLADPRSLGALLEKQKESPTNLAQQICWTWAELPVPVIAAIQGYCLGGGLQLALAADIRYAATDARLSVLEIEHGLIPDMSITQTLLPLVRPDIARELTYTGRIVEAEEAVQLGLVTRVCEDPLAAAMETATAIARRSPHAIRAAKKLYREAPKLSLADALALEERLQLTLVGSPNQLESTKARLQKRPPRFSDPD